MKYRLIRSESLFVNIYTQRQKSRLPRRGSTTLVRLLSLKAAAQEYGALRIVNVRVQIILKQAQTVF